MSLKSSDNTFPARKSTLSFLSAAFGFAAVIARFDRSTPTTENPVPARYSAFSPVPHPTSRTLPLFSSRAPDEFYEGGLWTAHVPWRHGLVSVLPRTQGPSNPPIDNEFMNVVELEARRRTLVNPPIAKRFFRRAYSIAREPDCNSFRKIVSFPRLSRNGCLRKTNLLANTLRLPS